MAVKKSKEIAEEQVVEKKSPAKKVRKLDDRTEVTIISNVSGLLFYKSPRTQDMWEWAEFGDEHEMSIQELKTMKAQFRKFFEDKWIVFHEKDADAIPHLKLEKYYKDVVVQDAWDDVFEKSVAELSTVIDSASFNEKSLLVTKAREKYADGELTNFHIIKLIEEKLQVDIDINNPK